MVENWWGPFITLVSRLFLFQHSGLHQSWLPQIIKIAMVWSHFIKVVLSVSNYSCLTFFMPLPSLCPLNTRLFDDGMLTKSPSILTVNMLMYLFIWFDFSLYSLYFGNIYIYIYIYQKKRVLFTSQRAQLNQYHDTSKLFTKNMIDLCTLVWK
jgi:hypothetical protein